MMNDNYQEKNVAICDTQPITAEGLRSLLVSSPDLEFKQSLPSLESTSSFLEAQSCDIAILDKGFGMRAVLDWIHDLKLGEAAPTLVVWGVSMTEAEALRLLQAGARGIGRKTAEIASLLAGPRTVASGRSGVGGWGFRDFLRPRRHARLGLAPRGHHGPELG